MLVGSSAHVGIGVTAPISASRMTTKGVMIRAEVVMVDEGHFIIIPSMDPGAAFSCKT